MLISGETFNQRKAGLFEEVRKSQAAIKLYQKCAKTFPSQVREWAETITLEKELLMHIMNEIVALKKWRIKIGIGEDDEWTGLQTKTSR